MANASLQLVENLCGCGNYQEMNAQELITNDVSTEAKRLSAMSPIVAYIQPTVEVVKNRSEQYEAHLDFPVNKSVILTDFMNNHSELVNIHSMFDKIQNDKNLTVQSISIEGFASPEGPLAFNEQLSKKRAEALKDTPKPTPDGDSKTMTLKKLREMNPADRLKFSQEHPEEYKELYTGGNE